MLPFMRSTACWSSDARTMSALDEPRRGWGNCVHLPDPCTTSARVAHQQALQQVASAMGALTVPPAVLPQLLLHGIEHGRIHDRRHRHRDPVPRRRVRSSTILPWLLTAATHRPQSRRPCFGARLAERGLAPVGGVPEQVPDRRALPYGLAMAS